jgi:hypothetical protein
MIQQTFGYTLATLDPESDKGAQNTTSSTFKVLAVGLKSEVAGFAVDVDWKDYRRPNFGLTTSPSNEDHTTSIWTNIAYTWDNLTPFVNIIKDDYDVASTTTTDYKRTALSAGLMIKKSTGLQLQRPIKRLHRIYLWQESNLIFNFS